MTDTLKSDPPLSGKMYFECVDADYGYTFTNPMEVCADEDIVQHALEMHCNLRDAISVHKSNSWEWDALGCEYQIEFWGLDGAVPMFELKSSEEEDPIDGVNLEFDAIDHRPYGGSLIYQSIPAEWF